MNPKPLRFVKVVCDGPAPFVAGYETDGVVRYCSPILTKDLLGKTDAEARKIIKANGWYAIRLNPRRT